MCLAWALSFAFHALAVAQDATFMPGDTISVQGSTVTREEITMECRVWIPAATARAASTLGKVWHEQGNSITDRWLSVGSDGVCAGVYPLAESVSNVIFFPHNMPQNRWCHVAVVRKGGTVKAFVNGVEIGSFACGSGSMWIGTPSDMRIGASVCNGSGDPAEGFTGRIDWLRISSIARYTSAFAPPTEQSLVPADASTELLLRFNDRWGSTSVVDDSPHHFLSTVGDARAFPPDSVGSPRLSGLNCPSDLDGDGEVSGSDISLLLLDFGTCP